jgi:hypothetical protein
MMREEQKKKPEATNEQHQSGKFQIKVKNKFNREQRSIRIRPSYVSEDKADVLDAKKKPHPHTQTSEIWPPRKKYDLSTMDYLIIELIEGNGDFKENVYIELPYVADYEFFWELELSDGEEVVKKRVDRPITAIKRNTSSDPIKQTENAKTVIVTPPDQAAWKLKIQSPRNSKEHYQAKNLLTKHLEMENGEPDDVSVGENGTG